MPMSAAIKRVGAIAVAALLLIYIAYQGYQIVASPLTTETVTRATAYQTLEATGVVYRDETVITQTANGYLFYTVANGDRVSKYGKIADVFASESDALAQQQLEALDAELESLSSINAQGTANRANLAAINQQLNQTWTDLSSTARKNEIAGMSALRSRLLTLLNKQQITIGRVENFDGQLAALRSQRAELAKSFKAATSGITSPAAGYFIGEMDGYEKLCGTKGVTSLTVEQLRAVVEGAAPTAETGIGKVVEDYEWYLACVLPLAQASTVKMGTQLEVCMPFVSSEVMSMQVVAVNKDTDGNAVLVLQCTQMSQALSTARIEQVEIRLQQYDGIRIPDSALYFNDSQEPGVYVQAGNVLSFRRVRVLYHDANDKYSVCEITDDSSYAQLYDKMVVKGEKLYDGKLVR